MVGSVPRQTGRLVGPGRRRGFDKFLHALDALRLPYVPDHEAALRGAFGAPDDVDPVQHRAQMIIDLLHIFVRKKFCFDIQLDKQIFELLERREGVL